MTRKVNQVRIISGELKHRQLNFPYNIEGLRPTPDRVRETLFNWLAPYLEDAKCLDAFAGSGALGIEALSRGANHVVFVDQDASVISNLKENLQKLAVFEKATITRADFSKASLSSTPFDIIFLDPPFEKNLLITSLDKLWQNKLLKNNTLIYFEWEENLTPNFPPYIKLIKQKKAGQVNFALAAMVCED